MPEIIVHTVAGRSNEQYRALMKDITDAVVKNFGADPDSVTVSVVETPRTHKMKGGIPFNER
jgi:4-oxalocrotonate tautomerase